MNVGGGLPAMRHVRRLVSDRCCTVAGKPPPIVFIGDMVALYPRWPHASFPFTGTITGFAFLNTSTLPAITSTSPTSAAEVH